MTKKHFEKIAEVFKHRLELAEATRDKAIAEFKADEYNGEQAEYERDMACARVNEVTDMARAMARTFWDFNHNFDNARFLAACGID